MRKIPWLIYFPEPQAASESKSAGTSKGTENIKEKRKIGGFGFNSSIYQSFPVKLRIQDMHVHILECTKILSCL